jgi:hypothetical protein
LEWTLKIAEICFTVVFSIEMVLKIVALGFCYHSNSYMRSGFNMLDFITIVASYVAYSGTGVNLTALRMIRTLRPLRSVSKIKPLKLLLSALLHSLPSVLDVVMLMLFIMLSFAIMAVQQFEGSLHQRCYQNQTDVTTNVSSMILFDATATIPCGGAFSCPKTTKCEVHLAQFSRKFINYDHVGKASLSILKILSSDDWADNLLETARANNVFIVILFFFALTSIGSYFAVNMFLAVLSRQYKVAAGHLVAIEEETELQKAEEILQSLGGIKTVHADGELAVEMPRESDEVESTGRVSDDDSSSTGGDLDLEAMMMSESQSFGNAFEDEHRLSPGTSFGPETYKTITNVQPSPDVTPETGFIPTPIDRPLQIDSSTTQATAAAASAEKGVEQRVSPGVAPLIAFQAPSGSLSPTLNALESKNIAGTTQHSDNTDTLMPNSDGALVQENTGGSFGPRSSVSSDGGKGGSGLNFGKGALIPEHGAFDPDTPANCSSTTCSTPMTPECSHPNKPQEMNECMTTTNHLLDPPPPIIAGRRRSRELTTLDVTRPMFIGMEDERSPKRSSSFARHDSGLGKFRWYCRRAVVSKFIGRTMICITLLNVLVLAIDHHDINRPLEYTLDTINLVCTILFALELTLKLLGFGFVRIFRDPLNVLDFLVIAVSIPEFAGASSPKGLTVFRAFRLLRVVKLVNKFESLQAIIVMLLKSVSSVSYLMLLIFLFIYIFSILGMQLFGTSFPNQTRESFDTIWNAAVTLFIVLTGENWFSIVQAAYDGGNHEAIIYPYFFVFFLFGKFVLFNLFIAIAMDTLGEHLENSDSSEIEVLSLSGSFAVAQNDEIVAMSNNDPVTTFPPRLFLRNSVEQQVNLSASMFTFDSDEPDAAAGNSGSSFRSQLNNSSGPSMTSPSTPFRRKKAKTEIFVAEKYVLQGRTLFLFGPGSTIRQVCAAIILSPVVDSVMMFIIVVNLVLLSLDSPHASTSVQKAIASTDVAFTVIFFVEMFLKLVALGGSAPPDDEKKYMRKDPNPTVRLCGYFYDTWNILDAFVAVTSFISLFVPFLKIFRCLRVLRLVCRVDSVRIVAVTLLEAIPSIVQGTFLAVFVLLVFGILGVQLFKGKLYSCNDETIHNATSCVGTYLFEEPYNFTMVNRTRQWTRNVRNYDNIAESVFTLFKLTVGDDWQSIMYEGVDATEVGHEPRRDAHFAMVLYFILFVVTMNFFIMNMIVGILINVFMVKRKQNDGTLLLTPEQAMFIKVKRVMASSMFNHEPEAPFNVLRLLCYNLVKYDGTVVYKGGDSGDPPLLDPTVIKGTEEPSYYFDYFIMLIIVLNMVALSTVYYGMSSTHASVISSLNIIFITIFTFEAIVKIFAYGRKYFEFSWNRFDFIVCVSSLVGLGVNFGSFASTMRVVRVVRVLKLVKHAKGLQRMFNTVLFALPSLGNVMMLLLVVFYLFGIMGVQLFGSIRRQGALNEVNNFEYLWNAMLLLYQTSSSTSWMEYLSACQAKPPNCSHEVGDCGNVAAVPFFIVFMVVCFFVLLQLCVAVIVENFFEAEDMLSSNKVMDGFAKLRRMWAWEYGTNAEQQHVSHLPRLFRRLSRHIRKSPLCATDVATLRAISQLNLPVSRDLTFSYRELVNGLLQRTFDIHDGAHSHRVAKMLGVDMDKGGVFMAHHALAVMKITRVWKQKRQRENMAKNFEEPSFVDELDTMTCASPTTPKNTTMQQQNTVVLPHQVDESH